MDDSSLLVFSEQCESVDHSRYYDLFLAPSNVLIDLVYCSFLDCLCFTAMICSFSEVMANVCFMVLKEPRDYRQWMIYRKSEGSGYLLCDEGMLLVPKLNERYILLGWCDDHESSRPIRKEKSIVIFLLFILFYAVVSIS